MGMRERGGLLAGKDNKREIRPRRLARDPVVQALQLSRMNASSAINAAPAPSLSLQHNSSRSRQIRQECLRLEQLCCSPGVTANRGQDEEPLFNPLLPWHHLRPLEAAGWGRQRM